jgi:hypothetical protein
MSQKNGYLGSKIKKMLKIIFLFNKKILNLAHQIQSGNTGFYDCLPKLTPSDQPGGVFYCHAVAWQ